MNPGDIVLFYRSQDHQAITSIGIVESYEVLSDVSAIVARVKRRTVYSMEEITDMARKPTKVMLFWLVRHVKEPLSLDWLGENDVLNTPPQSIRKITDEHFEKILAASL